MQEIIREILLDHVALVAEADDELLHAERRIQLHDVPENRPRADFHHGLRPRVRLLGDARALAAGENDALHARARRQVRDTARSAPRKMSPCSPPPHAPDTSPRSTPAIRAMSSRGRQPSDALASADDRVSACASAGCGAGSRTQPGLAREARAECVDHLAHRAEGCRVRPEIDSARRAVGRLHQGLRQGEIARQRLEHVLPGPDRIGVAQSHRLARPRAPGRSRE